MKPKDVSSRRTGSRRADPALWSSPLPMEWMDPMSWRLPSGKALAEFALQAGFLAPLMLGVPAKRYKAPSRTTESIKPVPPHAGEGPDRSGTFRETR